MAEKYTVKKLKQILKDAGGYRALKVESKGYTRKQDLFDLLVAREVIEKPAFAIESPKNKGVHPMRASIVNDEALILKYSSSLHESVKDRIEDAPDVRILIPASDIFKTKTWNPWRQLRVEYELLINASLEWESPQLKLLYYVNNPDIELENGLLTMLYPDYPLLIYFFILDYPKMRKAAYLEDLSYPFVHSSPLSDENPFKIGYLGNNDEDSKLRMLEGLKRSIIVKVPYYGNNGEVGKSIMRYLHLLSLPMLIYAAIGIYIVPTAENLADVVIRVCNEHPNSEFMNILLDTVFRSENFTEDAKKIAARRIIRFVGKHQISKTKISSSLFSLVIAEYPKVSTFWSTIIYIDNKTIDMLDSGVIKLSWLRVGPETEIRHLNPIFRWFGADIKKKNDLISEICKSPRFDLLAYVGGARSTYQVIEYSEISPSKIVENQVRYSFKDFLQIIEIEKGNEDILLVIANLTVGYSPQEADKALKIITSSIHGEKQRKSIKRFLNVGSEELDGSRFHIGLLVQALLFSYVNKELTYDFLEYIAKYIDDIAEGSIKKLVDNLAIGDRRNPLIAKLWQHEDWGVVRLLEYYIESANFPGIVYSFENSVRAIDIDPLVILATTPAIRMLIASLLRAQ